MSVTTNITLQSNTVSNANPIYTIPLTSANIIVGNTGQNYGAGGWTTVSNAYSSTTFSIQAPSGGDAIIKTNKHKINLDEIADVIETVKERLLILAPAFEKHEKYPALKEAYDHYKLIEALCKEEDTK